MKKLIHRVSFAFGYTLSWVTPKWVHKKIADKL